MRADCRVVLDACVLIPMPLADTLQRMAEAPRLYLPRWSQAIMDEVTRNLIAKWDMAPEKARQREEELRRHFPEAWVEGYEPLIDAMTNDPGDRHVLAAAVRAHSELIVTYGRRHFPAASVRSLEIDIQAPSTFLRGLYDLDAGLFVGKLQQVPGCFAGAVGSSESVGGGRYQGSPETFSRGPGFLAGYL